MPRTYGHLALPVSDLGYRPLNQAAARQAQSARHAAPGAQVRTGCGSSRMPPQDQDGPGLRLQFTMDFVVMVRGTVPGAVPGCRPEGRAPLR